MSYTIRDEKGMMIANVDNEVAAKIIGSARGFFRPYRTQDKPEVTVFEITEDLVFGLASFKLYLWAKTKLIPD